VRAELPDISQQMVAAHGTTAVGLVHKVNKIKQQLQIEASVCLIDAIRQANVLMGSEVPAGATLPAQVDLLLRRLGIDVASLKAHADAA